jgi:predicted amidophosphoribosyltransferase
MSDVFISYSRKNLATRDEVVSALEKAGLQVWTDASLTPGTPVWEREIGSAIENSKCIVVLMTPHSKDSEWVMREINFARTHKRHIVPVFVQGEEQEAIPFSLTDYQRIDMRFDRQQGIQLLIAAIKGYLSGQQPEEKGPSRHASYRLSKFELLESPDRLNIRLWGTGAQNYVNMLINAFPELHFDPAFADHYRVFDWGTLLPLQNNRSVIIGQIRDLLQLFQEAIYIDDYLDQNFALDTYVDESQIVSDGPVRSKLGEAIDRAKITEDEIKTQELAAPIEAFILRHPAYTQSDVVMTIPSTRPFNLATRITEHLTQRLNIKNGTGFIRHVKKINWEQRNRSDQGNLHGNFEVEDAALVRGKVVTIFDDVYLSGTHLNELALTLKESGAKRVQGIVITKR